MTKNMIFRDSAGNTRSMPMPEHVQIEMAACIALDQLQAALASATGILAACGEACELMASEADGAQVHMQWAGATTLLNDAFLPVHTHAQALCESVRKMLAV